MNATGGEFSFQRFFCREPANLENREPDYVSALIYAFHHRVVRRVTHVTGSLGKGHLQEIALAVVPDFYFVGHICFLLFGSVFSAQGAISC